LINSVSPPSHHARLAPTYLPFAAMGLLSSRHGPIASYLSAVTAVLTALLVAWGLAALTPAPPVRLVFVAAVLLVASLNGLGPALAASALSLLAFTLFFMPPFGSLPMEGDADLPTLTLFGAVILLTAHMASRLRSEAEVARSAAHKTENLYAVSRRLATAGSPDAVLAAVVDHLAATLDGKALALTADLHGTLSAAATTRLTADGQLLQLATTAWLESEPKAPPLWHLLPLDAARGRMALIVLRLPRPLDPEQRQLVEAIRDQAALALERTLLATDLAQARLLTETEQLRSALLSSLSHDLRTPLASIIGSTGSLLAYGDSFAATDRRELLQTVLDEAERLNRYIQNLLDMTRLGHGVLKLQRDWSDLHDIVATAVERLRSPLACFQVEVAIHPAIPLLYVQGVLLEQVLVNLLDNAACHSAPGETITIRAEPSTNGVEIAVLDRGPGIPEADRERVFDMFYSAHRGDRRPHGGTGLGLAICRGLVTAHGGHIEALAGPDGRGTTMRITLPIPAHEQPTSDSGEQP